MKLITLITMLIVVNTFTSCKKDSSSGGGGTESASVITFTSPLAATIVLNGTPLKVEGTISDNNVVGTAKVEIRNKTTGAVYYSQSTTTPSTTFYRFAWSWTVTGITVATPAVVKVTARDLNSVEVSKEVEVTLDN